MRYIETFREKETITGIYYCSQKSTALSKTGKEYASLKLQDKTGVVDAKIWNLGSAGIREFDEKDYVYIKAEVTVFNGAQQLNVAEVRVAEEGTYDEADYLPCSAYDIEEMYTEFMGLLKKVKNPYLQALIKAYYVDNEEYIKEFKKHSAAKRVHHGFVGGLLEHTLSVTRMCDTIGDRYTFLNKDLLVTAAAFHDMGKVYELSAFPDNDYTDAGQLLGHIVMGSELISSTIKEIPDFPKVLERQLKHCILAHHGEFEYGSPKKPALAEALALHYADDMDAKLQTFKEAIGTPQGQAGEWLGFNKMLDSNIRKTL